MQYPCVSICLAMYALSMCFHMFSYICSINVFPYHQLLGLLSSWGGHGISTVLSDLCVCCANKSKTGTDKSAHELHSELKESLHPMLEDEPMPAGFTGLLAQDANHCAMALVCLKTTSGKWKKNNNKKLGRQTLVIPVYFYIFSPSLSSAPIVIHSSASKTYKLK